MFDTLRRDLRAVLERDPAARSLPEVLFCYPGLHAIWSHRVAHWCWLRSIFAPLLDTSTDNSTLSAARAGTLRPIPIRTKLAGRARMTRDALGAITLSGRAKQRLRNEHSGDATLVARTVERWRLPQCTISSDL